MGIDGGDHHAPHHGDLVAPQRFDASQRFFEMAVATDVFCVHLGVGAIKGYLHVRNIVCRQPRGDAFGDEAPIADDLNAHAMLAQQLQQLPNVALRERLAAG